PRRANLPPNPAEGCQAVELPHETGGNSPSHPWSSAKWRCRFAVPPATRDSERDERTRRQCSGTTRVKPNRTTTAGSESTHDCSDRNQRCHSRRAMLCAPGSPERPVHPRLASSPYCSANACSCQLTLPLSGSLASFIVPSFFTKESSRN